MRDERLQLCDREEHDADDVRFALPAQTSKPLLGSEVVVHAAKDGVRPADRGRMHGGEEPLEKGLKGVKTPIRVRTEGLPALCASRQSRRFGPLTHPTKEALAMPTDEKVNLTEKLALFDESFRPKIIGTMNDYKLQVVKVRGEFVWHSHEETDDFFLVLNGQLTIQLRDRDVELFPGELFVVPRRVEHCPRAENEAYVLLIEPIGTINTGETRNALTASEETI